MGYELRRGGASAGVFGTEEEAIAAASAIIREDADAEVEVVDTETGRAVAPGASRSWREELARRVGF